MGVKIEGAENLYELFDKMVDTRRMMQAVKEATLLVEGDAKQKAPRGDGGGNDTHLRGSIESKVEQRAGYIVGTVFTPVHYAPYVEYGTGIHAEKGGTSGYWVYVDDETSQGAGTGATKRYTKEEAQQIVAMMRDKGLKAYYTNGQRARPYMRPALYENRENIKRILKKGLINND